MAKNISINRSKIDAAHFPATKIIGFENNNQTLVLAVSLKPNCTYDFAITDRSSQSSDGYAFRETEYEIRFKTKP
ncbi:hypothetical protein ACJVDH_19610 [Pedobacter sp. AW1-32]|uniref:hypothetical protein n=1 Tax=Pedobacter sp. AW1-32 TaxID=3383026 RepID=UPI003FEDE714